LSEVSGVAATPSPSPERLAASTEVGVRITAALEELKPVERAAFTLRHFEGRSIDDIARTLGIRSNAAKQHVFRAIRKLRAALDEQRG
jgi:RNA polymerase sigma-70 factor (ECF subfamily)